MNPKIRQSILSDAEHFLAIKERLPISIENDDTTQGGFLLGTDLETYRFYINHGFCYTAIASDEIIGFGIMLPNQLVKQSEIWEKRKTVSWKINLSTLEKSNVAYLEQLAFLKGHRKLVLILSYNLVHKAFENGADFILTTTVKKPVLNLAAIPLIKAAGGRKVGNIDEVYDNIGDINSDLYLIEKTTFHKSLEKRILYDFLVAHTL